MILSIECHQKNELKIFIKRHELLTAEDLEILEQVFVFVNIMFYSYAIQHNNSALP